jgi:cytochrome c oxidase subunit I
MPKSQSRLWLLLGTTALAIAGLFSLVLVVARTPQLASLPFFTALFHQALVVHVDLSVLVWFLAIACLMWSLLTTGNSMMEKAAQICFTLGMTAMTLSPLDTRGEALMSNYIPVIHSPLFFVGLALILCGTLLMLVRVFIAPASNIFEAPMRFALKSAAVITLIAIAAFFFSYSQMPSIIDGQQYYDLLFWGGGHVLQFTHVQITMICWLLLAKALVPEFDVYRKHLYILFTIGLIGAFLSPGVYLIYSIEEWQHRAFFTNLMITVNGIAPTVLALWILPGVWSFRMLRRSHKRALWSALLMSLILFIYGGVLGALIEGQNVVIPAHYHGSIVGITLAFMGAAYMLLPRFGYRDVAGWKLAYWQPIMYGVGQLMHISGLAYSGGYGVLRKTPGEVSEITASVKVALGFMGMGGLLAIAGGFMFVIVIGKSVFYKD